MGTTRLSSSWGQQDCLPHEDNKTVFLMRTTRLLLTAEVTAPTNTRQASTSTRQASTRQASNRPASTSTRQASTRQASICTTDTTSYNLRSREPSVGQPPSCSVELNACCHPHARQSKPSIQEFYKR
ncbi:hypothetical protein FHG87_024681 [Trinorchestia longiramus]|nr:hypothetical protein FHG87_024681 [Trinorchestia longiramus]